MDTQPYWLEDSEDLNFSQLKENLKVDVVVVGAGITGITAAYLLKQSGKTVALVERGKCLEGDTSHTTAHLTQVTDLRLHLLVKVFGKDHAQAVWDAGSAAMQVIERNIEKENIDCDFKTVPAYLFASLSKDNFKELANLKKDAELANHFHFDAEFLNSVPLFKKPGVRFPNQAKFHPVKYLRALLKKIPGDGSYVFENTEANEFCEDPVKIQANGYSIRADYLVIATHVPLMGNANILKATLLQTKLSSYSTYAIRLKLAVANYPEALYWDTSNPYYYLRIDKVGADYFAIFGGEDHKTGQVSDTEQIYRNLFSVIEPYFPNCVLVEKWSGQVVNTNDGLPLIGEITDRQFVATGFSGNGMTFGTLGGVMAYEAATGIKSPWKNLFNVRRKKMIGGVWNYLKENKDYPYYLLKDFISGAEGNSIKDVPLGEGKVVKVDGQKVAIYRDSQGESVCLSATCTHLGCTVHWNSAEKTWDCPCHGSRFKTNGEVLAGPAETPLSMADLKKDKKRNA